MQLSRKIFLLVVSVLFFLSGIAGLIYESIWSHYLKLFVGHAAYSQTLVLVIYMGGMALGAWVVSLYSRRIRHLLIAFAAAEIILGLAALTFHPVFAKYLSLSYNTFMPALDSVFLRNIYKWITASLMILPQTILLGATFPLMTGGIIRRFRNTPGHSISLLYFVNSFGGALGVLLSGYYLVPRFTLPGTIMAAGILDLAVAAGVLALYFMTRKPEEKKCENKSQPGAARQSPSGSSDKISAIMLILAFCTAASSFIYEIGWIRMLSLVLGSSTHSFELMLSAFILGIAVGGFWIRNKVDKLKNPLSTLAIIQVMMGIFAVSTLVFYSELFHLMEFFISALSRTEQGYIMFNIYSHVICLLVMLPATICIGMTLPIITYYTYKRTGDESIIGKVYACNTVGSITGVVLAVQLLMPLFGLKGLIIIGAGIDMILGALLALYFREKTSARLRISLAAFTAAAVILPVFLIRLDPNLLSSGVYRFGKIPGDKEMIYYKDGKTASVSLYRKSDIYSLAVNGKVDASVSKNTGQYIIDEHTQILLAAYPLAYGTKAEKVGVVGLGSGMTAATMLESDAIKHMDVVEIEPFVVEAAKRMGPKVSDVFTDSRCEIHIDDARSFFSSRKTRYDIIISEPSNPWISGVSNLFSGEFFSLVNDHLTTGGMLVQWFHLYEMNTELIASVLKSLGREFSDYKVFVTGTDMIILASDTPIPNTPHHHLSECTSLKKLHTKININNTLDLKNHLIGGKKILQPLVNSFDIPANSDYNQVLDLRAAKARILNQSASEFAKLASYTIPIRSILESDPIQSREFQTVHSSSPVRNNSKRKTALEIYNYISSIGTPRQKKADSTVSGQAATYISRLKTASESSFIAARRPWAKRALDLVSATMPYLSRKQMKVIWEYIGSNGKKVELAGNSKEVLSMLHSISFENYSAAKNYSLRILNRTRINDNPVSRLCLSALFLSSIKLNDFSELERVWESMQWRNPPDLVHTLLASFAADENGKVKNIKDKQPLAP
ncbi:MAG: fused MFS/spermidine synthase [Chitinispirillaceae bacterium]